MFRTRSLCAVGLVALCLLYQTLLVSGVFGAAADNVRVLLGRGTSASERSRQLIAGAWLPTSPAANVGPPRAIPPPVSWMRMDYDDSGWVALPVSPPGNAYSRTPPPPGALWLTPPSSAAPPPVDGGLIFTEELLPDGGVRDAGVKKDAAAAAIVDGGAPADGGVTPLPPAIPPCAGTLYLRRRFSIPAVTGGAGSPVDLTQFSTLTLRIRYSDGFVAYLNGVEVVRRRLPDAGLTEPNTLASERGPVEAESHRLQIPPGLLLPEGNLLAVEVHPRAAERCPRAELELLVSDGPRVTRGPYIERLLDGNLELTAETDTPTNVEVTYGKGDVKHSHDRILGDSGEASGGEANAPRALPQTVHRVRLTGLRPGNTYHYQMRFISPQGLRAELPLSVFHTPPAAGRPLRFVVYGDSRSGHAVHAQVVQAILEDDPDLVLSIGDVVERGSEDSDWDRFFAVAGPLLARLPLYMAPGNHEYARRGQGAPKMFQIWSRLFLAQPLMLAQNSPPPQLLASMSDRVAPTAISTTAPSSDLPQRGYYSFDVAGVHFVAIDSNQVRNGEQLRWLEADLQRATSRRPRAIIVWMHDGPYSRGFHGDNSGLIREYVPVLERYHVSMVFSGHDHDYERGHRGRLDYIVTGGGGAELRPLKCDAPGKRRCKHPPLAFFNEHNFVSVEVLPGTLRLCAKRPDGSALEPCQLIRH